jgi:hypothetical protein
MSKPSDPIPFRSRRLTVVEGSRAGSDAKAAVTPAPAPAAKAKPRGLPPAPGAPTDVQKSWLARGLSQPGGKLPLFDDAGRRIDARTIRACIDQGWAEPWFANPLKPDWLVCRLTDAGRTIAVQTDAPSTSGASTSGS